MPKVKEGVQYKKNYSEDSLLNALQAVKNGMPKRTACKRFGVPRATLQFRLSEKFRKVSHGPSTILTVEEEATLVSWINECQRK